MQQQFRMKKISDCAFLTSSFFSKLSMRSFLDARLALVYLFWDGRYKTWRKIKNTLKTAQVTKCAFLNSHNVYLSVAFLPHLAVGVHAEIAMTHSSLHHLHLCCQDPLCLSDLEFSCYYTCLHQTQTLVVTFFSYLLHLLRAKLFVGVRLHVSYMWGVVGRGGGASGFATLQLTGCVIGWVVQTVVVQHGDHFLFDQFFCQLEVWQRLHGGGSQDRLVHLQGHSDEPVTSEMSQFPFKLVMKQSHNLQLRILQLGYLRWSG